MTAEARMKELMATTTTVEVMSYTDETKHGNYGNFLSRLYTQTKNRKDFLKTVVFGRAVIDRGVNMIGANFEGPATDMFMNLDHHYTGQVHGGGRLCGFCDHDCTPSCPNVGTQVNFFLFCTLYCLVLFCFFSSPPPFLLVFSSPRPKQILFPHLR